MFGNYRIKVNGQKNPFFVCDVRAEIDRQIIFVGKKMGNGCSAVKKDAIKTTGCRYKLVKKAHILDVLKKSTLP